ncbi:MAG: hypothetical protein ACE5H4_09190 [Candidatus Thorarchaeota archaeon]
MNAGNDFGELLDDFQNGLDLMKQQRFKQAENIFLKLVDNRPEVAAIWLSLAKSQFMQLRLDDAERSARRFLEQSEPIWRTWELWDRF